MGKLPHIYTDSEETEDTSSSVENMKKKKRFSILKYTKGNVKKKKCNIHSRSEPEESEVKSRSSIKMKKLRGILKHDRYKESSDEEDDIDVLPPRPKDKYLVGRVPRTAGSRPGRGGGVAIVVRKNTGMSDIQSLQAQCSTSSTKRRLSMMKRLSKKISY